jgi:hypothetical protein
MPPRLASLLLVACLAQAADDLPSGARELARRTAALGPVTVTWRNISSLGSAELAQARAAFEGALPAATTGATPVRITLSENPTQFLLIEEAQTVWIVAWPRTGPAKVTAPAISLDRKLVWEQNDPILDVAMAGGAPLVLSPTGVQWNGKTAAIPGAKSASRDPRGRLRLTAAGFEAFLPGMKCSGVLEPSFTISCQPGDEPWLLESGSRAMLLATFASTRNYFDGRTVTQTGARKTVAPFYSAAAAEEQGRPLWLAATLDGRVQIFSGALDPLASFSGWGSDLAGTGAACGGGAQILATRPGDEAEAVQAFAIVGRAPVPLTAPMPMSGPVIALWPAGSAAVTAIVHDTASGKYAAYLITVACGG